VDNVNTGWGELVKQTRLRAYTGIQSPASFSEQASNRNSGFGPIIKVLIVFRSVNGQSIYLTKTNVMETIYFLGIDISKKTFQAALTVDGINVVEDEIENRASAIKVYFQSLREKFRFSTDQLIVCLEHTGIYCLPALDYLTRNKIKVCVEPALQIKQSQGMTRGKSDQVDARRIAQYAYKNRSELKFWKPQRSVIQKLKALLTVRDRLVKIRVQLQVPINESTEFIEESIRKMVAKNCQHTLKALEKDILKIETQFDKLLQEDTSLNQQMQWATSVPGVGKFTAINVIITSGEFERISDVKKFACYAGVAPFEHSSGSSIRGKTRVSKMANMNVKKLLHLAAVTSIRHRGELQSYYQRKLADGKNKMSVINAVRNKLITRIFLCIKQQRCYQKDYCHTLV
jgi:transposase